MSRVSKAVRELRIKYGLDPDTGLQHKSILPVQPKCEPVIVVDRFIDPPRRMTPKVVTVDPLGLIVIALRAMADYTQRDDLRPQYRDIAEEVDRIRLASKED